MGRQGIPERDSRKMTTKEGVCQIDTTLSPQCRTWGLSSVMYKNTLKLP